MTVRSCADVVRPAVLRHHPQMNGYPELDTLRDWIEAAQRIVVLTGAGISTDSGIPDFRGPKGVAFKFKRRKGFHKTKGFRRCLTKLEITSIAG